MKIGEAIKAILKGRKVSVTSFAKQACDFQSAVDRTLRGDMKMSKVTEYCELLGYEVVIRPKRAGRKEDGAYIIGGENE